MQLTFFGDLPSRYGIKHRRFGSSFRSIQVLFRNDTADRPRSVRCFVHG